MNSTIKTKFFDNVTWPKVVLLVIVIMIVTRALLPDVADWIMIPIRDLIQAARDFGGSL